MPPTQLAENYFFDVSKNRLLSRSTLMAVSFAEQPLNFKTVKCLLSRRSLSLEFEKANDCIEPRADLMSMSLLEHIDGIVNGVIDPNQPIILSKNNNIGK